MTEPVDRRTRLNESLRAKALQLVELQSRTDVNGHVQPRPSNTAEDFVVGGVNTDNLAAPPTLSEQIAVAEGLGEHAVARILKAKQLAQLDKEMNR